jgi:hypothetical protein
MYNGIAHENAAIDLAQRELETERERRGERREQHGRRYEPLSPEWEAELDRLDNLVTAARILDESLGAIAYHLVPLKAVCQGERLAYVQAWIDELMPQKWQAERDYEAAMGERTKFIMGVK